METITPYISKKLPAILKVNTFYFIGLIVVYKSNLAVIFNLSVPSITYSGFRIIIMN